MSDVVRIERARSSVDATSGVPAMNAARSSAKRSRAAKSSALPISTALGIALVNVSW